MLNKKLILISIAVIIVGFIAGWIFLSSGEPGEERGGFFGIFPSRDSNGGIRPAPEIDFGDSGREGSDRTPAILTKVTPKTVAGAVIFQQINEVGTTTETVNIIRFVEMGTGYVYETSPYIHGEKRLSNTTIPKTRSAHWSPDGEYVLIQYEADNGENLRNFVALVENVEGDLSGQFLPENISSPVFSPDGTTLAYVEKFESRSDIVLYNLNNRTSRTVFSSPAREWQITWSNNSTILMNTTPSSYSRGFVYSLNISSGSIARLAGNILGLSAIQSPNEAALLASISTNRSLTTVVFPRNAGSIPLSFIATEVKEKCFWAPERTNTAICAVPVLIPVGNYPDDWYMGKVSFSDMLWEVNTDTGSASVVLNLTDLGLEADMVDLIFLGNDHGLIFKNKKDHSLWFINTSLL